jgi:serine/threonine-protein kinase
MSTSTGVPPELQAALAGDYDILRQLGEGGMAVVYLATDLKHNREVAIKVLKEDLAAVVGEERFLDEIQTTAKLQHPNILPLFDSGARDGFLFYAMPYVEGETLREKLKREVQLPVEDALELVQKIASALDYAHEKGIVHRDIKPANILLSSGEPLIADFGIALAVSQANDGRRTETGLSLGTPHYMSPEQAAGDRSLDPRSDIYALGCVLQELLTGEPPFSGANAQAVLARILTTRPTPVTSLRPTVPPHVDSTIGKALEKLPADRFKTAKDFRKALRDPDFRHTVVDHTLGTSAVPTQTRIVREGVKAPIVAGIGAAALMAGIAVGSAVLGGGGTGTAADSEPVRTRLALDLDSMPGYVRSPMSISPDGARFAWESREGIRVRGPLDETFRLLTGTERGRDPEFSPDGEWIAYADPDGNLMRVSFDGAEPRKLVDAGDVRTFSLGWGDAGWIALYGFREGDSGPGLFRVPEAGGAAELLIQNNPAGGVALTVDPVALPGGVAVLATDDADQVPRVVLYVPGEDSVRTLVAEALSPRYVDSGHLLYVTPGGDLLAQPFDLRRLELTGDARPVLGGVHTRGYFARYDVSRTGSLVFGSGLASGGGFFGRVVDLGTVTLDGRQTRFDTRPRSVYSLDWGPSGRMITFRGPDPDDSDGGDQVWVYDTQLENAPRAITELGANTSPTWSPDGSRIAFVSDRADDGSFGLFTRNPNTDEPAEEVWTSSTQFGLDDWPSDSTFVVRLRSPSGIFLLTLGGDTTRYYTPEAGLDDARVSPNGDWMSYSSNESGEWEVYVRAFPEPGLERKISSGGGDYARWGPDGRTIYYLVGDSIHAADLELEPTLQVVRTRPVIQSEMFPYDIHPDGDRFVGGFQGDASTGEDDEAESATVPERFHLITNFFTELERIFDDGGR